MSSEALGQLTETTERVQTILVAMEQSPSFLMLADANPNSVTYHENREVLAGKDELWPMLMLVQQRLAEAHAVAEDGTQVGRLLTLRDLTATVDGADKSYSLSGLVSELSGRTKALDAAVDLVESRWQNLLPRITAANETLERLEHEVAALGVTEPLVSMTARRAGQLAELLVTDPLAVAADDGAKLDRLVADAARQVTELRVSKDNLDTDLNSTEELLANLRVLRARAESGFDEANQKIVNPEGLIHPPSPQLIDGEGGLADRLDQLLVDAASGRWEHKRARLDAWLAMTTKARQQLERAISVNQGPLNKRNDLRGRLTAYRSKIAAKGRAEDLELAALVNEVHDYLYQAPTDLDAAEESIGRLAKALRT